MLVTDNDEYAARARLLRGHGITRDSDAFTTFVGGEAADMADGIWDKADGISDMEDGISNIQRSASPISSPKGAYPSGSAAASSISHIQAAPLLTPGPWTYEMQTLGYNYRITDFQCALGRSQLKKLPDFIRRRQEIVDRYNSAFGDLAWLDTPKSGGYGRLDMEDREVSNQVSPISSEQSERISHIQRSASPASRSESASPSGSAAETPRVSWHLYTVQIDFEALGKSRNEVMAELREQGVGTQVLYIPVYLQPWYQETYGYGLGKCPNAEAYYAKTLSLPLYPAMTDTDVETVMDAVQSLTSINEH
jgi:dTDP-4-amino-4,6-dideoxygalactose transaminase